MINWKSGKKLDTEKFEGFSIIQSLDSQASCHSLRPVSYNIKEFENSEQKNSQGLVFDVFQQLESIRQDLVVVEQNIQVVHTQQEIKNVRVQRSDINFHLFDTKVKKFEKKVSEFDEKIRKTEKIVESLEKVEKGLEKGEERFRDILSKHNRIEKILKKSRIFSGDAHKK